jgi:hypothetical protein
MPKGIKHISAPPDDPIFSGGPQIFKVASRPSTKSLEESTDEIDPSADFQNEAASQYERAVRAHFQRNMEKHKGRE